MTGLIEKGKKLIDLKTLKKELDDRSKELTQQIKDLSAEMVTEMDAIELDKFSAHGKTFYVLTKLYTHLPAENREEFIERLNDRGLGDIVRPTINPQTLTAFTKEQIEASGEVPDWMSDLINASFVPEIAMRTA